MTKFELPTDTKERIQQALAGRVCTAPDGSYLYRTNGRSKAGRAPWYVAVYSDGGVRKFRAESDEEAVTVGNNRE